MHLTRSEAAKLLGVGFSTMDRLAAEGMPRTLKPLKRGAVVCPTPVYDADEIVKWYEGRKGRIEGRVKRGKRNRAQRTLIEKALTVEETVFFFGLKPFHALAWRGRFQPLREETQPYDLMRLLFRATSAMGSQLVNCGDGFFQVPREALERAREVLRPVLQGDDQEDEGVLPATLAASPVGHEGGPR